MAKCIAGTRVEKGDRVCIYLPMIPELAIATLACARIGAIHSVVFAGFSASAVATRINDSVKWSSLQTVDIAETKRLI
jgi:acetyl-CoA synthetase